VPASFSSRSLGFTLFLLAAACALPLRAQSSQKAAKPDPKASVLGVPAANVKTAKKLKSEDNVALIGHRNVGKGLDFYSQQKEIALGQSLAQQVMRNSKVITDPVVNEYINRVAQNLVRNSDAKVAFTVHVLQDDTVNAFALPGGFFFVNSGLILAAHDEDQMAGAMAHEIAHVAARHATRTATKAELMQLLAIPAIIAAGPGFGGLGAEEAANVALPAEYEHFSRGDEEEADWLGTQYLWKAGYDPQGMAQMFEILEAEEQQRPGLVARFFASHPETNQRIALTEKEIATILPLRPEYVITTSDFNTVQARLRAIIKSQIEQGVKVPGGLPPAAGELPKAAGPPIIKH
jgi:predicted Zn-dependent protease